MELDWTTVILQIVNFLILLWILQRLLYRPVAEALARRRAVIDQALAEARSGQARAAELERKYRDRLAEWEQEKRQAQRKLREELAAERERLLAALQADLAREGERQRAIESRHAADRRAALQAEAIAEGARFASRLLARLSSPALEAGIAALLCEDLEQAEAQWRRVLGAAEREVAVTSAYPLGEDCRDELRRRLGALIGRPVEFRFSEEPGLIAGVRINFGPGVIRASLLDELSAFAGDGHADDRSPRP